MIQQNNDVSTLGGTAAMQNFSIEMNESMFTMLTKNVYTDTILAVMREWSTNAIDACIDAGTPIKYKVNLPTLLSPKFSVRDYGTGLTAAEVAGLFATLGASTKRESNEFNGTFGIGRMSGLAYTDSFTVNSYRDHRKYSYLISTDSGIPQVISLGDIPTDEPNGLCLSIVTKAKDASTFCSKAAQLYRFFDHKPITNQPIKYPNYKIDIKGKDWFIEDTDYHDRFHDKLVVIMGNVGYEVGAHSFPSEVRDIAQSSVRLSVPLGSVSITPGRESLSMDEATTAYLTERLKLVAKEAVKEFTAGLITTPEGWERAVKYGDTYDSIPYNLRANVKYKPNAIEAKHFITGDGSYKQRRDNAHLVCKCPNISFQIFEHHRVSGKTLDETIPVKKNVHFMIADIRTNVRDAVAAYRVTVPMYTPTVIILKPERWDKDKVDEHVLNSEKYLQELGNPTYVKASDYFTAAPKVVKTSGARTATDFAPIGLYCKHRGTEISTGKSSMISKYASITTFYYVETKAFTVSGMPEDELSLYLRFATLYREQNKEKKDFEKFMIIGVPKNGMANIKNDARFVPLKGSLQHLVDKVSIVDYTQSTKLLSNVNGDSGVTKFLEHHKVSKELEDYLKAILAFEKKYPRYERNVSAEGLLDLFKCKSTSPKTDYTYADFIIDYPLLAPLMAYRYGSGYGGHFKDPQIDDYLELTETRRSSYAL